MFSTTRSIAVALGIGAALFVSGCSSSSTSSTSSTSAAPTSGARTAASTSPDPVPLLSGGRQAAWFITQRVTTGGKPELPDCAKDDELIFDAKGGFISVIGGTQCNPSEAEVPSGKYEVSADNKVITFTTPTFSYPGKIVELTEKTMVLEFDLGPGFLIQDSFSKR
jgi:Lipocalin-like domain